MVKELSIILRVPVFRCDKVSAPLFSFLLKGQKIKEERKTIRALQIRISA